MVDFEEIIQKRARFYREHLSEFFLAFFTFWLLLTLGRLPYLNLIEGYNFIVFALVWLVIVILFKITISIDWTVKLALFVLVAAIPFVDLGIQSLSEWLGFIAFIIIFSAVIRRIVKERKSLLN